MQKHFVFCEECQILWSLIEYKECPLCKSKLDLIASIVKYSDGKVTRT